MQIEEMTVEQRVKAAFGKLESADDLDREDYILETMVLSGVSYDFVSYLYDQTFSKDFGCFV